MGISFSHGDYRTSSTRFYRFLTALAASAGIPLPLMEGHYHPGGFWPIDGAIAMVRDAEQREEAWGRVLDLCHGLRKPEFGWRHEPPLAWSALRNQDDPLYPLFVSNQVGSLQTGPLADRMAGLREAFLAGAGAGMAEDFDGVLTSLREAHAKREAFTFSG
jgi:hypothetical protein